MPYIETHLRKKLDPFTLGRTAPALTAGELDFQLTKCILRYMEGKEISYQVLNDIMGALEGAKLEFYRRMVAEYEDVKIEQNGDLYPKWAKKY